MLKYELKKLVANKVNLIGFLSLLAIVLVISFASVKSMSLPVNRMPNHNYQERKMLTENLYDKYKGPISDKKIKTIINDYLDNLKDSYLKFYSLYYNVYNDFAKNRAKATEAYSDYLEGKRTLTYDDLAWDTIKEHGLKIDADKTNIGIYDYFKEMYQLLYIVFLIITLYVIFAISPIFSRDRSNKIESLIFTTKYGKNKLILTKFIASIIFIIFATVVFVCFEVIPILAYYWSFSFKGWDTSIQMLLDWRTFNFSEILNLSTLSIRVVTYQFIGLIFIVSVVNFISTCCSNMKTTLLISLVALFSGFLLDIVVPNGIIKNIFTINPFISGNAESLVYRLDSLQDFVFGHFSANYVALIIITVILSLAFFLGAYLLQTNKEYKNTL